MKRIIAILLITVAFAYAANLFTLETIVPKNQRVYNAESKEYVVVSTVDYQQLRRNFDKIENEIRYLRAKVDSLYACRDTVCYP